MKEQARLIIPIWGEVYAQKLVSITLPAVLAPGNLPALCKMFDVELVLVTESRLFDLIRSSRSFQLISDYCRTKLIPIDDLLTDIPGDYGVVLTCALFRGFVDLGAKMTETYLLFLNADFIISNGSLHHLGKLMLEGKRVIHAPSFRVVLEEIWPELQSRVDPATSTLSIEARAMVKLALTHKHLTVRARTANQRLFHQSPMDQFYWYVNEDTLIGYQWPIALVAVKPERVVLEPALVWDFGFIPEASPTAPRHFIVDFDDFFMLEPQRRISGSEMVRLGWPSLAKLAKDLDIWTTKDQRDCGGQLLTMHAADLPPYTPQVVSEFRAFMAALTSRMSPTPQPHVGHPMLGSWFEGARERMKSRAKRPPPSEDAIAAVPLGPAPRENAKHGLLGRVVLDLLQKAYLATFGVPPNVGKSHPLWADFHPVLARVLAWRARDARILWLSSGHSLFHRVLKGRIDVSALVMAASPATLFGTTAYDACLCELTVDELADLRRFYRTIRPLIKDGGEFLVLVLNKHDRRLTSNDTQLCETAFPDTDCSEIRFCGTAMGFGLRRLYLRASNSWPGRPLFRALTTAAVLIGLAPLVRLANQRMLPRDASVMTAHWSSIVISFEIKKRGPEPATTCKRCMQIGEPSEAAV